METSRATGVVLKAMVLALVVIVITLWAMPFVTIFNPRFVKSTLSASGVYESLAEKSVQILTQEPEGAEDADEFAAVASGLTPAFERVLTPELLRSVAEPVVDSLDDWLNGETEVPRFRVDTSAIRSDLNQSVARYISERFATLPECPGNTDYRDYDPITSGCRPPYEPSQDELLAWSDDFTSQIPLLSREQVSDVDLVSNPDDRVWQVTPRAYSWTKIMVCVLGGLFVLITALVLTFGKRRPRTLQTLGHGLVIPAVLLVVGGIVVAALVGGLAYDPLSTDTAIQAEFATDTVVPLLQTLIRGVGIWTIVFGAIYGVLAAACYMIARRLSRGEALAGAAGPSGPSPGDPGAHGPSSPGVGDPGVGGSGSGRVTYIPPPRR